MAKKRKTGSDIVDKSFLKDLTSEELDKKLRAESLWGIITNDNTLFNPLLDIPMCAHNNFDEYLVYLMGKPEYFYFIIKIMFGMDTFPMQLLILKELFTHRFPILIGSRGLSKCVEGNSKVITRNGIRTIKSLIPEDIEFLQQPCYEELYGGNTYNEVEYGFYNGEKETKKIKTRSGRIIECTLNHPLRVVDNGEIVWKNAEDIKVNDFIPIQRKYEEWEYNNLDKDVSYMIGAMVGDGCYSTTIRALGFTNIDQECIDNVNIGLKKWNDCSLKLINLKSNKVLQYTILGGKALKNKFIKDFGCNKYSATVPKETPNIIWGASFNSIASYISGLFDTDGCCPANTPVVELSSKSRKLLEDTQFLLLILGINSIIKDQLNKKYNKHYYKLQISGSSLRLFKEKIGFRIKRKQDLLDYHCSKNINDNIDIIPKDLILDKLLMVRELARDTVYKTKENKYGAQAFSANKLKSYNLSYGQFGLILKSFEKSKIASSSKEYEYLKDIYEKRYYYDKVVDISNGYTKTYDVHLKGNDHSFISNGFISHNSFTLGIYILIRMITTPGVKVVITGAGFRQAKLVFDVMESIWNKAPMLRNCFKGSKNGPFHGTDAWSFRLGDSICYALPVGHDGSKIRGYRANCVGRNTLIQTDIGLVKISDYLSMNSYSVLNMNKEMELPDKVYKTNPTDVYKVVTANGYSIKCSNQHRLLTTNGAKTEWKYAKDLKPTDYLEMDNNDYFPDRYIEKDGVKVDENMGFLMGVLISEGTLTNRNFVIISHTNKEFIDEIRDKFPEFNWILRSREAHIDPRGWKCKKSYNLTYSNTKFRETLKDLGLDYNDALKKEIPHCILQSPRSVIVEFLKGLFLGDGSCFKYTADGKLNVGVTYYSSSETLIDQLQVLLLKFNITGSKNGRYTKLSGNVNYMLAMRGEQAFRIFNVVRNKYWEEHIIKDGYEFKRSIRTRKKGNSYIAETTRCDKNIYLGSFKDVESAEKAIINYWETARPVMRVKSVELLEEKEALYDFVMPETESFLGGGFVNHNCLVLDEMATVNQVIFEEVMSGFLSVSADSIEQMRQNSYINSKKKMGLKVYNEDKNTDIIQNQLILSGTAYYKHNHFYEYYSKWCAFINSRGDFEKVKDLISEKERDNFNYKDYAVMRIPVELIQSGHMDMSQISRIRASISQDVYFREYGAIFSDDSDGFYRRSLINHCTVSKNNVITKEGEVVKFGPSIFGKKNKKHVYGIDPAYQGDNFAIVILEINDTHRRVVHCWTTQASDHKQRLKDGIITENNYYQYCVRKIRDLMTRFPCAYIALDKGGGGTAILESFADTSILKPGEVLILPVIDPTEKPQDTDFMEGDHILHVIKPTSEWNTEANHSLKRDMETRDIIFPFHDEISYVEAEFYDPIFVPTLGESSVLYDTLEDCMSEIEELKNELSTITISETTTGKEHFDTPEKKTAGMKKGRLKKDRYSALLMANMIARNAENLIVRPLNTMENAMEAYFGNQKNGKLFLGNGPIAEKLNALYF